MGLIPTILNAGATLSIPVTLTAYPAPDWSLVLVLRGPGAIDVHSTPDDTSHTFAATAAVTSSWAPGRYWWAVRAISGIEVIQVEDGELEIAADLALATSGHDGRSHARRTLDAIQAVIESRATLDQQSYQIAGRMLARTPIADLLLLRNQYRAEVAAEQRRAQTGQSLLGRKVQVRF